MTDDERRLLLAVAACVLADRVPGGPDREQQITVLRKMLEPFSDFMRKDIEKEEAENSRRRQ